MALDWSKEITFSGLRKSVPKRKEAYPSKTYMNLAVAERAPLDLRKAVPLGVLAALLVIAFLKFGVFDLFAQVSAKQAELARQQEALAGLEVQLAGYDDVLAEYQSFMPAQFAADADTVGALDAIDLVNRRIVPAASVASMSYDGNELVLSLANISLGSAGDLVSALYGEPVVDHVEVSSAATGETGGDSTVAMTISLKKAGEAQ